MDRLSGTRTVGPKLSGLRKRGFYQHNLLVCSDDSQNPTIPKAKGSC